MRQLELWSNGQHCMWNWKCPMPTLGPNTFLCNVCAIRVPWIELRDHESVRLWAVSGEEFVGHNRSKSSCFQFQRVTCCDVSVFLWFFLRYIPWIPQKMISYNPEVLNFTSYFSNSTGSSITNGWFSCSLASCMQVIHTRGSCHEMVQNVWINLVFAIPHRVGFGQTNPYTRSLLDA